MQSIILYFDCVTNPKASKAIRLIIQERVLNSRCPKPKFQMENRKIHQLIRLLWTTFFTITSISLFYSETTFYDEIIIVLK